MSTLSDSGSEEPAVPSDASEPVDVVVPVDSPEPLDALEPVEAFQPVETLEPVDAVMVPVARGPRRSAIAAAFAFGLLAILALAAGAIYAFDQQYAGRVLPGVHVGATDLTGLTAGQASARLNAAFASVTTGSLTFNGDGTTTSATFEELNRHLDVAATVDAAMAVGRSGSTLERIVGNIRTAVRGVQVAPRIVYDGDALLRAVTEFSTAADRAAADATVTNTPAGFALEAATVGRKADSAAALKAAAVRLVDVGSPTQIQIDVAVARIDPAVSTVAAGAIVGTADRMARDIKITDEKKAWTIPAATVRTWISFGVGADGTFQPIAVADGKTPVLAAIAKAILRSPLDAQFLFGRNGSIVGVKAGHDGRRLDPTKTAALVTLLLQQRVAGIDANTVSAVVAVTKPKLSTEQATASAPLMVKISSWTTKFQLIVNNGFGANIWIPALTLDRYVVAPGAWFDFWKAIGPITRAKGYTDGGAIIDGHSEPTGALAGGICSCSTTLFNAVARAGFQLGARKNHFYYINRYPLGLDATVFESSSGSVQTMSWRNDTKYPVLIRGYKIRSADGAHGYVRFELYSVPNGRSTSFSTPIVRNVLQATDTVQYTDTLPAGTTKRVEYPDNGMDVWVTRTVRDRASGKIIHQETFYSHYARITGLTLIGTGTTASTTTSSLALAGSTVAGLIAIV